MRSSPPRWSPAWWPSRRTGIGGYGGHLVVARPDGKVTAIDFNCGAPAAARPDMFPPTRRGS